MVIKNIKLYFQFFGKNKLKFLAFLIIAVINCIVQCLSVGYCNYLEYSLNMYDRPELKYTDYVDIYNELDNQITFQFQDDYGAIDTESLEKTYSESLEDDVYHQIEQLPVVDKVYRYDTASSRYDGSDVSLFFSDEDTARVWNYELSDGCWFWKTKQTSEYPNAVVCGSIFKNVKTNSDIEITYLKKRYKIHVIGKVAAPYRTVDFTGNYISGLTNENRIFFLDNKMNYNTFGASIKLNPTAAFVKYKDSASSDDIDECRYFYRDYIYDKLNMEMLDPSDIHPCSSHYLNMEGAEIGIREIKTNAFLFNFFFTAVTAFILIILAALMVKSKMLDFCIYRFCGCTRIRSFLIFLSTILSITVLAGIMGSAFMLVHNYMICDGMTDMKMSGYIYGGNCYLTMWLTLFMNVLLCSVIPFIVLCRRKINLITLYRTEKQ